MTSPDREPPLHGVRVIEIGQVISAPFAGLLLADLGAEVIKVERPGTGDSARNPEVTGFRGKSATFLTLNRNKASVCLDLTSAEDYGLFAELIADTDVLLTNMVPAVARRLRTDPESVRQLNPAIITCRVLGFRADHPQVEEPSFDLTHQALAGYLTLGGLDGDEPARVAIPVADLGVALFSVIGILAALHNRARTGQGDDLDVPMFDTLLSLLTYQATLYLNEGQIPQRLGSAHPHTAPWQTFRAADRAFVIAVRNEKFWLRLCQSIGLPQLAADPRFASNALRIANRAELQAELERVFAARPADEWLAQFRADGVPVAPVQTIKDALDSEVTSASPLIQHFTDSEIGEVAIVGNPLRFRRMRLAAPRPAPGLDEQKAAPDRRDRRPLGS